MFCDVCERHVQGVSRSLDRVMRIKDEDVKVSYTGCICPVCFGELYNEDIEEQLVERAKLVYKQKKKLLPSADITAYMKRKKLTPEEMAAKVQCSAKEIIMASHGGIQSKELDTKLREVVKKYA